jgi:hypothetical protein
MLTDERHEKHALCDVYGRRVRASTRLTEAAKALATRDYVRGISGPSALSNTYASASAYAYTSLLAGIICCIVKHRKCVL